MVLVINLNHENLFPVSWGSNIDSLKTRFDVYETLCPQQMLVHKGGQIENWSGECRDIIPTKLQCPKSTSKSKSSKGDNSKKNKITFF